MQRAVFLALVLAAVAVMTSAAWADAAFPEYRDQDSDSTDKHAAISTSDGDVFWDDDFADMVADKMTSYQEVAFAFMQCYGGGMIDELMDIGQGGLFQADYTSASEYTQIANWGNNDGNSNGNRESYYNIHFSPYVGGATVRTFGEAADHAYEYDYVGRVQRTPALEFPQCTGSIIPWDRLDIRLHSPNLNGQTPDKYLAILWGGSVTGDDGDEWRQYRANYHSLVRIHADLIARGYDSSEIYLMWPDDTGPGGAALPASWVVDDGTSYQDMQDAWQWVNDNATDTTQVFFWSNVCHGSTSDDFLGLVLHNAGEEVQPGQEYPYDLSPYLVAHVTELFYFFGGGDGTNAGQPFFQVIASERIDALTVTLNGRELLLLEVLDNELLGEPRFLHKFALGEADVLDLGITGNTCMLTWSGGAELTMAGVTAGTSSNAIPEPATVSLLLGVAAIVLVRRRRR